MTKPSITDLGQGGSSSRRRTSVRMNSVERILDTSFLNRSNVKGLEKDNVSNSSSNKSIRKPTLNEKLVIDNTSANELIRQDSKGSIISQKTYKSPKNQPITRKLNLTN